jgi:hypothetical protein
MRKEPIIDRKELFERIGYHPHSEAQASIHTSDARFRIPTCGRRFGKSLSAGHEMTAYMFTPDSRYWICAPSYRLGEKEFRVVHDDLIRKLGLRSKVKASYNTQQGQMRLEIPAWNTVLEVVSAERTDSLVGEGLDGVIMSEAALHKASTWSMYIEPALSDKRGWAIFPSTPRGFNWYQGLWQMGQDPKFTDYASWKFPTWTNTAMFPGGREDPEIQRLESIVSKQYFLQEYAADFTAFEGQIYEDFDPAHHVKDITYNPQWKNFWVFDFGFVDPLVCLDVMVDPDDNVYVWREYQVSYLSTWEHGNVIKNRKNPEGFHVNAMFGDPRGADGIATLNLILGHVQANAVGWGLGVEAVRQGLKLQPNGSPKLFIDRSCVNLIRQMEQLRYATTKEGKNSTEKQHDYDDHGPDALRYFYSEYFVLRSGQGSLADVYGGQRQGSEAATFFQNHQFIKSELLGKV